jgi:hypothetical protein
MPFTLAHPAAILPLRHMPLLRTAPLVVGALIPDLPYYVPATIGHQLPQTHTFEGSLTICLALGLAVLVALFVLREPLTVLLPARARWLCLGAMAPFGTGARAWLLAPLSIVLGVWTHLLWDSFTHVDSWVVRHVAALSAPVDIGPYHGNVCHVLQYLSSVFGLVVLTVWYLRLPAPPRAAHASAWLRSSSAPALLLAAAAAVLIGGVQATEHFDRAPDIYRTLGIFLTHSLAWFALLYLVAGVTVTLQAMHERAVGGGA